MRHNVIRRRGEAMDFEYMSDLFNKYDEALVFQAKVSVAVDEYVRGVISQDELTNELIGLIEPTKRPDHLDRIEADIKASVVSRAMPAWGEVPSWIDSGNGEVPR